MPKVEEHIRRAMDEGNFDDLPGKGKPLHLEENPLEDPEWRLASHVLRNGGFTLPWIEARREIERDIDASRATLARAWRWRKISLERNRSCNQGESDWQKDMETFCEQVIHFNQRISNYNLQAPSLNFHLITLDAESEIRTICRNEARQE